MTSMEQTKFTLNYFPINITYINTYGLLAIKSTEHGTKFSRQAFYKACDSIFLLLSFDDI
jgi:hypothetical protein